MPPNEMRVLPTYVIVPFENALYRFYNDTIAMNIIDYDLIELTALCVDRLKHFDDIEDEKADLLELISSGPYSNPKDIEDASILTDALSYYFDGVRSALDMFDSRDSSGTLLYGLHQVDESFKTITFVLVAEGII